MYALIVPGPAGTVYELFDAKPVLPEAMTLIDVSDVDDVAVGWTRAEDGGLSAPPTATPSTQPITQVNFLSFLSLFTTTEQAAIVNSTDPRIKLFCLMAAGASLVDLTDPRTISGTQLLESLALIAKGRAANVLAGQTAPAS